MSASVVTVAAPGTWLEQLERSFPARAVALPSGDQVIVRECGQRGAAPSLVLLHGISSGAASWLQVAVSLTARFHVVAWDAPGYGQSTPLRPARPTAQDYAIRLQEMLEALHLRSCVLAGHSLGALMAAACAQQHPHLVARLVLISPARGYADRPEEATRVRTLRLDALREQGVAGLAAQIDERLLSPAAGAEARQWVRWNAAQLRPDGYRQAVEMLCGSTLAQPPQQVAVEVHCGADDIVTPPANCEQVARQFGAPFHLIAGAGHASQVEQPHAVAGLLAAAMARAQEPTNA